MVGRKINIIVGFFVTLFVVATIGFLVHLLEQKGVFEERYSYGFTTDSAESLVIGMPIKFSGFEIGVIDSISLEDDGSVTAKFSIQKKHKKWVSYGTVLMLTKPLIGSAHINLYTSMGTPALKQGASLPLLRSDDINDLIVRMEPILKTAGNILKSVDEITTYLASDDSEIKKILRNLEKMSKKLADEDALLTSLTGDKTSTKALNDTLKQTKVMMLEINKITKDIAHISARLQKDVMDPASSSMQEVDTMMQDINHKLKALDGTVNTVGSFDKELVDIKEQIRVGLQKSDLLMDKVDALLGDDAKAEVILP